MAVEMNRISTHKSTQHGTSTPEGTMKASRLKKVTDTSSVLELVDRPVGGVVVGKTTEGHGMYTFVYNKGSQNNPRKVSETRHMSEGQAKQYKEALEKAGF